MPNETIDLEKLPFPLTETDRRDLKITDEEFEPHTWEELKLIIGLSPARGPHHAVSN